MIDQFSDDRTGWARFSDCQTFRYRLARSLTGAPLFPIQQHGDGIITWDGSLGVGISQHPISQHPKRCVWLMLNPSTADAFQLDPTVNECRKRSIALGCDVLEVVNLFALRSPYPEDLRKRAAGERGDDHINNGEILGACMGAAYVIAAWGNHGELGSRAQIVREKLDRCGIALHHLGTTYGGFPKHPLARGKHRIPADQQPIAWSTR